MRSKRPWLDLSVSRFSLAPQRVQLGQQRLIGRFKPLQDVLCLGRSVTITAQVLDKLAVASQVLLDFPRGSLEQFQPART